MLSPSRVSDPASARAFARPYRGVAERLRGWERSGHARHDDEPAIYLHEYTSGGLTVRGLVGTLDLTTRASLVADSGVLPHEGVHLEQVAELADRMSEMRMNPAPILLSHHGPLTMRELTARVRATEPWADFYDKQDQRHRVWAIREAPDLDAISAGLAESTAVIADGHHRYAAYLRLQEGNPGTAWDRGLVMLVDQDDTPLFLGPIHRDVRGPRLGALLQAARDVGASVETGERIECVNALAADTLVMTDGAQWATVRLPELSGDRMAVDWLDESLLPALSRPPAAIRYHHSVSSALDALPAKVPSRRRRGPGRSVILMPSLDFDHVLGAARAGRLLPQKATSFQPKPGLGVLMRALRDE